MKNYRKMLEEIGGYENEWIVILPMRKVPNRAERDGCRARR